MQDTVYLGNQRLLVRLAFGGYIIVPTWNVDVGVGVIRDGVIEPWTTSAVRALLGKRQTYVNVGANFGYYTIMAACHVDRGGAVHAIEANPYLIPDLIKSTFWSGYPDVIRVYQCAVADAVGSCELHFDPQFIGGGSINGGAIAERLQPADCFWSADKVDLMKFGSHRIAPERGFYTSVTAPIDTLDNILHDVPEIHLLHMDIEGSEPAAILGGRDLIRRSPDASIIMEWSPSYAAMPSHQPKVEAMYEFLSAERFHLYQLIAAPLDPSAAFPECRRIRDYEALLNTPHCDLLAVKAIAIATFGLALE